MPATARPMRTGSGRLRRRVAARPARGRGPSYLYGFTYIGLLIALAVMGVGLAAVGSVSHTAQMRANERELLFVGDQFRRAIALYYERTPSGIKQYPKKLEELLRDNRHPSIQRYLRKLYVDPITGSREWGLVELPGIGITGVYSLSDQRPVKTANFPAVYESFRTAKKYSDWKFVYLPGQGTAQPAVSPSSAQPPVVPRR